MTTRECWLTDRGAIQKLESQQAWSMPGQPVWSRDHSGAPGDRQGRYTNTWESAALERARAASLKEPQNGFKPDSDLSVADRSESPLKTVFGFQKSRWRVVGSPPDCHATMLAGGGEAAVLQPGESHCLGMIRTMSKRCSMMCCSGSLALVSMHACAAV